MAQPPPDPGAQSFPLLLSPTPYLMQGHFFLKRVNSVLLAAWPQVSIRWEEDTFVSSNLRPEDHRQASESWPSHTARPGGLPGQMVPGRDLGGWEGSVGTGRSPQGGAVMKSASQL